MTRRRQFFMLALVGVILIGASTGIVLLVRHEPGFYRRNLVPEGKQRKDFSMAFFGQFTRLLNYMLDSPSEPWSVTFSEAQINSYFLEDFLRQGDADSLRKYGISDPRVSIEKDHLRLAFRYANALASTVFSIDMRIWLVPKETNVFAVEVLSHQMGAWPVSVQSLREDISELAAKHNIEVTWYRYDGHPVALVHIQSDRPRPTAKFNRLEMQPGTLTLGGVSAEQLPPNAQTKKLLAPVGN